MSSEVSKGKPLEKPCPMKLKLSCNCSSKFHTALS